MNNEYLFVLCPAYAVFTSALAAFELNRIRRTGPDAITIFVLIYLLQCCLPGIGIYAALPLIETADPTGNWVFDGIFENLDSTIAWVVLALSFWFVAFFYVGAAGGRAFLHRLYPGPEHVSFKIEAIDYRLLLIVLGGLALTLLSFYLSGDDLVERYANLIRLRGYSDEFERTTLNAYAFELTQAWGWLSIPALFVFWRKGRKLIWLVCLVCAIIFAVLSVSRRAIFIPITLCYFTVLLNDKRWRGRWIVAIVIPTVVWIAYGKEILSSIAFGGSVADVTSRYESSSSAILRANSEQGITIVESLGTFIYLDEHLRLGVDHLLSIAQKLPFRLFGLDVELPKRMVRISTEAFAAPETQDVPPGLFGQMWLDFRIFGPVTWGLFLGAQISVAQFVFERAQRTLESSALVALAVFLIALPINTGSYDFTISIDVFVTVVCLLLVYRARRVNTVMRNGSVG